MEESIVRERDSQISSLSPATTEPNEGPILSSGEAPNLDAAIVHARLKRELRKYPKKVRRELLENSHDEYVVYCLTAPWRPDDSFVRVIDWDTQMAGDGSTYEIWDCVFCREETYVKVSVGTRTCSDFHNACVCIV